MKLKFTIIGERVHKVGYRAALLSKAFSLGMDYFSVFNSIIDGRQAVIVLIDGEEVQISEIRNFIKSFRPERAAVDEIREEEYKATVPSIDRAMQAFQTEQWAEGIPILLDIRDNVKLIPEIAENTKLIPEIAENTKLIPEIAENTKLIPEIAENTRLIRDKQEEHINITKEGFAKLLTNQEELMAITKSGFESVARELRGFRELHEEIRELREEFEKIKESVAKIERRIEA